MLGYPGFWVRDLDTGIDWVKIVNGEQGFVLHQPLQAAGTVIGKTRIVEVIDKGAGKGALVYTERKVTDKASGDADRHRDADHVLPRRRRLRRAAAREPAAAHDARARARSGLRSRHAAGEALIYRLSADRNPLHADPDVAKAAGFPRPILHGLGTFGVVGHALLKSVCGYDPARVTVDSPGGSPRRCFRAKPSAPRSGATAMS